jgi:hypothetical protein
MYRIIYLLSLVLGAISFLSASVFIANLLAQIDELSGNAGAFAIGLSMGVGILGIISTTLFGVLSGSIVYIYSDKLPTKKLYSPWWPVILLTPCLLVLVMVFSSWIRAVVVNGL